MLRPPPGSERARVIGLLDAFQAAERAGVEAVGRWIVACADARLRGGLRMIRARDRRHAALAEARLRSDRPFTRDRCKRDRSVAREQEAQAEGRGSRRVHP